MRCSQSSLGLRPTPAIVDGARLPFRGGLAGDLGTLLESVAPAERQRGRVREHGAGA